MMRVLALFLCLGLALPASAAAPKPAKAAAKKAKPKKAVKKPKADPVDACFSKGADGKLRLKNPGSGVPDAAVDPRFVSRYEKGPYQFIFDHPDPHVGRLGCKDGVWSKVTEEQAASCGAASTDNGLQKKPEADCDKGGYVPAGLKVP